MGISALNPVLRTLETQRDIDEKLLKNYAKKKSEFETKN